MWADICIHMVPDGLFGRMCDLHDDAGCCTYAKELDIPQTRISEIIRGRRSITADTAVRLSRFFGTSEEFWMNLQNAYDLEEIKRTKAEEFNRIHRFVATA